MQASFWHQKWKDKDIAFHMPKVNPLLIKHFAALALPKGSRVFVPLCGKTLDIGWLMSAGFHVVGVEINEPAVEELFAELSLDPQVSQVDKKLKHYSAQSIDLFVGDFFDLTDNHLGSIDAIYDRAALVALPEYLRQQYVAYLKGLTKFAPQLLLCFDYDQGLMPGPPFSIGEEEVKRKYADDYMINLLESIDLRGGLKGKYEAKESVWLLSRKPSS